VTQKEGVAVNPLERTLKRMSMARRGGGLVSGLLHWGDYENCMSRKRRAMFCGEGVGQSTGGRAKGSIKDAGDQGGPSGGKTRYLEGKKLVEVN